MSKRKAEGTRSTSKNDERIGAITAELLKQLAVKQLALPRRYRKNPPPKTIRVYWADKANPLPAQHGGPYTLRSDQAHLGIANLLLYLPLRMREKLTPEEWRPIIASTIIYERRHQRLMTLQGFFIIVIPVTIVLLLLLGIPLFLLPLAVYFPFAVAVMFLSLPFRSANTYSIAASPLVRSYRLRADRETAIAVGPEAFLHTLRKIDRLRLPDIEKSKHRFSINLGKPSITDRIKKLESIHTLPAKTKERKPKKPLTTTEKSSNQEDN